MLNSKFEQIPCPLCNSKEQDIVYERKHDAGEVLGTINTELALCSGCGLMYMNPRLSRGSLLAHYSSASSGDVFHCRGENTRHGQKDSRRAAFIERVISDSDQTGNFLDIGCGQADLLRHLNLPSWSKFGIEPSSATEREALGDITIFNLPVEEFSPEGLSFDAVSAVSVLEHLIDPVQVVQRINKLIHPDGLLFLEVPNSMTPKAQIAEFFSFEHLTHFTARTLTMLLESCGFQVVEFDDNLISPNLRCCARKISSDFNTLKVTDDVDELRPVIASYRQERGRLVASIQQRIDARTKSSNNAARLAIYGAGFHTNFLLSEINLGSGVSDIIDSDPKKWGQQYYRWKIQPPENIKELDVDAIVISSHDYEEEIYQTIRQYNQKDLAVIRCYGD